ncbi:hypothetical protein [Psychrobacillus lasiicapitis]|uniref:Uncharacterized protein n=1 Tax=Psychrobacillus lasiicapitis TaxID=1636719 RepID=A0A544SWM6_9BACI|nr:hypothetical protein [Psychrobacillus lasiicapitis]TQR09531.1 hypothetical protein FG382_19275 [Psychrobacillus lasiicapitis]GGA29731.1 hypothetical protein GCM10011384_19070 [Psychrobacillus lasiicapitis]
MKLISTLLGFLIIFVGLLFLSTTILNEPNKNVMVKILGIIVLFCGIFVLKIIADFGKQKPS